MICFSLGAICGWNKSFLCGSFYAWLPLDFQSWAKKEAGLEIQQLPVGEDIPFIAYF